MLWVDVGNGVQAHRLEIDPVAMAVDGLFAGLEAGRQHLERVMQTIEDRVGANGTRSRRCFARLGPRCACGRPGELGQRRLELRLVDGRLEEAVGPELEHRGQVARLALQAPVEQHRDAHRLRPLAQRLHQAARVGGAEADDDRGGAGILRGAQHQFALAYRDHRVAQVLHARDQLAPVGTVARHEDLRTHGDGSVLQSLCAATHP
ncbi:hypothetical protein [Nannocystis exedens]|uniref:hypothetical protein n=1 Tax=Nannocystis exedens TaxID=54 RepID=UPI000BBA04C1|nr:hypothetical protein [Nannocystis exedens]